MHPPQFEALRERLLRAGIAPRHMQRYIRELRDHYDDALQAELANGAVREQAQAAALARLAHEEAPAPSKLAQPALRSLAARFPRLLFGVAPAVGWIAAFILGVIGVRAMVGALGVSSENAPRWAAASAYAACVMYMRVLPVLL